MDFLPDDITSEELVLRQQQFLEYSKTMPGARIETDPDTGRTSVNVSIGGRIRGAVKKDPFEGLSPVDKNKMYLSSLSKIANLHKNLNTRGSVLFLGDIIDKKRYNLKLEPYEEIIYQGTWHYDSVSNAITDSGIKETIQRILDIPITTRKDFYNNAAAVAYILKDSKERGSYIEFMYNRLTAMQKKEWNLPDSHTVESQLEKMVKERFGVDISSHSRDASAFKGRA